MPRANFLEAALHCTVHVTHMSLTLRRGVSTQKAKVWDYRNNIDAYTLDQKSVVEQFHPEIDHVVEVAMFDSAFERARQQEGVLSNEGFAVQHAKQLISNYCNAVENLNITTRQTNQKKKGPIGAAMRRLRGGDGKHELRKVTLRQFANMGAARVLVENGVWDRIETCMRDRSDHIDEWVDDHCTDPELQTRMHRSTMKLLSCTRDNIVSLMDSLSL